MTNSTRNYYTSSKYPDYTSFGGNVYNYDFDGYNSMSDIASRIITDWKFDKQCRKNAEIRDNKQNYRKGN